MTDFDLKYKDKIIKGSTFPDKPYKIVSVKLNPAMLDEYIPALETIPGLSKGMKLLITVMAFKEGFYKGTRSYSNNNPGNIGNTDSGANKKMPTMVDGIKLQVSFINDVINGKNKAFPMGQKKLIPSYFSNEIAKNSVKYGMSPYLPGYEFVFTGQLDQFVKIYSTGARAGNSYINTIVSYFKQNGVDITPESKIQDIIK